MPVEKRGSYIFHVDHSFAENLKPEKIKPLNLTDVPSGDLIRELLKRIDPVTHKPFYRIFPADRVKESLRAWVILKTRWEAKLPNINGTKPAERKHTREGYKPRIARHKEPKP